MLKIPARSKIVVVSTVLAVVLATTSATSVFAASATGPELTNRNLAAVWGSQYRELQTDRAIYDNLKSHPVENSTSSTSAEVQQYLNEYAFALSQADAVVLHGGPSSTSTVRTNSRFERSRTARQNLATFLHMMRGLREKIEGS